MKTISTNKQSGAVSLFIVIFFMLLVTVVTVGFLRVMVADQRQASDNDLSQSAYDSAQAGVEDAKRALLQYEKDCSTLSATDCLAKSNALSTPVCNAALDKISGDGKGTNGEIKVQQSQAGGTDAALNQAYTCVTINMQTNDYVGNLAENQSELIPLRSADTFDRVRVEWYSKDDASVAGSAPIDLLSTTGNQPLVPKGAWKVNRPPLVQTQLIQFGSSFTLDSFDISNGGQANSTTMFLYPTKNPGIGETAFVGATGVDFRKSNSNPGEDPAPKNASTSPTAVTCQQNLNSVEYACSAVLVLPQAIGATTNDRTAFLRLVPYYNATHFKVTLLKGPLSSSGTATAIAKFNGVQPEVDSTGRANDVFRRVLSRVNLDAGTFSYPEATIEVTGDFCKDFAVTDTQYLAGSPDCKP